MATQDINLELEERKVIGKGVKQLRRDGFLPAVIHDHGKPSVHVQGSYIAMYKAYQHAGKHHPIQLKVGGKSYVALIKTAEFEPKKNMLNHVVFGAVKADEKVTAEIPVRLTEDIPAERASLIVLNQLDSVEVEALATALPDEFVVDASSLAEVGDRLTVADIVVPANVTLLTEPERAIATVFEPSAIAEANEEAGGDAEPEAAADVPAEEGSAETDDQTSGQDEIRPGGKEELPSQDDGHNPEKK